MNYWLGVIGTWLLADGWYSLALYHDKKEGFIRCHLIRVIRIIAGIGLVIMGVMNK